MRVSLILFCFEIQDDAGGKTFSGWPGKNAAHDLGKANIQVKVKKNTDNFVAKEIFQPIKAINIETSRRILQAIGEGWIHIKYQEDSERASSPVDNITNQAEPAAKKVKLNRKAANKQSNQKKSTLDDDSEEEVPTRCCQIAHLGICGMLSGPPKDRFFRPTPAASQPRLAVVQRGHLALHRIPVTLARRTIGTNPQCRRYQGNVPHTVYLAGRVSSM
ncbi:hypothetical protein Pst134EA_017282 [Puccinia striiformis f. sp. tritici]|uniref:hypothetical protein n=1 Tax=Puccinia striiformis f. sp. tritici TaxID=168172 RepID=UPI00200736CD|nr:hypothetical protein Pst134EA_017282 [Puccinia striiformis f. sp. tritici]KAH9460974.1 hypothetical protein Pst134EA_017282 [Puccinia striiformis f. sp. tritici]